MADLACSQSARCRYRHRLDTRAALAAQGVAARCSPTPSPGIYHRPVLDQPLSDLPPVTWDSGTLTDPNPICAGGIAPNLATRGHALNSRSAPVAGLPLPAAPSQCEPSD